MRNVTKSELFVELNNANRRAMQAERKLAAINALCTAAEGLATDEHPFADLIDAAQIRAVLDARDE